MKEYLEEMERLYAVTNGVDGVYEDPQNPNVIIVSDGGFLVGGMPKEMLDYLDKIKNIESKKLFNANLSTIEKPYYRKFSRW